MPWAFASSSAPLRFTEDTDNNREWHATPGQEGRHEIAIKNRQ